MKPRGRASARGRAAEGRRAAVLARRGLGLRVPQLAVSARAGLPPGRHPASPGSRRPAGCASRGVRGVRGRASPGALPQPPEPAHAAQDPRPHPEGRLGGTRARGAWRHGLGAAGPAPPDHGCAQERWVRRAGRPASLPQPAPRGHSSWPGHPVGHPDGTRALPWPSWRLGSTPAVEGPSVSVAARQKSMGAACPGKAWPSGGQNIPSPAAGHMDQGQPRAPEAGVRTP